MCAWKRSEPWVRVPALAVSQHALEMIKKQFECAPFTVGNSALLYPHGGANGRENRGAVSSKEEGKQKKMKNLCSPETTYVYTTPGFFSTYIRSP